VIGEDANRDGIAIWNSAVGTQVINCISIDARQHALTINDVGTDNTLVSGSTFKDADDTGINIYSGPKNTTIFATYILNSGNDNIGINSCGMTNIDNCVVLNAGTDAGKPGRKGIYIADEGTSANVNDITIQNSFIDNSADDGIFSQPYNSYNTYRLLILNNRILNSGDRAFRIGTYNVNTKLDGNIIKGSVGGASVNSADGIEIVENWFLDNPVNTIEKLRYYQVEAIEALETELERIQTTESELSTAIERHGKIAEGLEEREETAENIANQVKFVRFRPDTDALIGVHEGNVFNGIVHSPAVNSPGIRLNVRNFLFGVKDCESFDCAAGLHFQKCRAVLRLPSTVSVQDSAFAYDSVMRR